MSKFLNDHDYVIGGATEKGITHVKKNMPNQDAYRLFTHENYIILTVADGHGSHIHFRSAIGSKLAVDATIKHLSKYAEKDSKTFHVDELETLKKDIYQEWISTCKEYTSNYPIEISIHSKETHIIKETKHTEKTSEYVTTIDDRTIILTEKEATYILAHPLTAYGSTLIATLVINEGTIILKLGDGDLRLVFDGHPFHILEDEPEMYGNQTYSLSSTDALEHFQIAYINMHPDLIYMSTDGVINSYADDKDYHLLGLELLKSYVYQQDTFDEDLKQLMQRFANDGSGDDCTICYAIHKKHLNKGEINGIK
jgi:serine/threonine protein phosphatase PrpC